MLLFCCDKNKKSARRLQAMINNREPIDERMDQDSQNFIRENKLYLQSDGPINDYWVKTHPNEVLRYLYYIQRSFKNWGRPNFHLVPISQIKSHFITIDTHALFYISRHLHGETENNFKVVKIDIGNLSSTSNITER